MQRHVLDIEDLGRLSLSLDREQGKEVSQSHRCLGRSGEHLGIWVRESPERPRLWSVEASVGRQRDTNGVVEEWGEDREEMRGRID